MQSVATRARVLVDGLSLSDFFGCESFCAPCRGLRREKNVSYVALWTRSVRWTSPLPPLPVCSVRNPRTASQPQPSSPRPLPQRSIRRATRTPTLTLSCCRIPSSLAVRSHISPPSCLPTRPRSLPQFASRLALAAIRTSARVTNHHHPRSCFVRLSCHNATTASLLRCIPSL